MKRLLVLFIAVGTLLVPARAADCALDPIAEGAEITLSRPVAGSVVREFGETYDEALKAKAPHTGVDLEAAAGESVYAARSGVVLEVGQSEALGGTVRIDHGGGWTTLYGHLGAINVTAGLCVKGGQEIAKAAATGKVVAPLLHFELQRDGAAVDPLPYLE